MKARVAVLRTSPGQVLQDYARLMRMAGYRDVIPAGNPCYLKVNVGWQEWFPAASTSPWQLEGVLRTLEEDGYPPDTLRVAEGFIPGDRRQAEVKNGLAMAAATRGAPFVHFFDPEVEWTPFQPRAELPAVERLTGKGGILIPADLLGANLIHLPAARTDSRAVIGGAALSALDTFLEGVNVTADLFEDLIVDALLLQKEVCGGVFSVLDCTMAADGPGPRELMPYEKNYIVAGDDPVAVDAVVARMMGFDPMQIGYIRKANEREAGCGETSQIEVVGEDISSVNFHFSGAGAGRVSHSDLYLNYYWYPFKGWGRIGHMAETGWGQLLQEYLPAGAELEHQGKGKGPLLAGAAAVTLLGAGALRRLGHPSHH